MHRAQASPIAAEALARLGQLYAIEASVRGELPPSRRAVRQAQVRPLLEDLRSWLEAQSRRVSRKSGISEAIQYGLDHWQALIRYAEDGRIEIDNNVAERALRAVALGRQNFLFGGSDAGGERAAALYSLIGTAKLSGLDPEAYLRDALGCIGEHPINRIEDLLPWNQSRPRPIRTPAQGSLTMGTVVRLPKTRPAPHLLQLRIELVGIKPPIWRRVVVPETITLPKLHQVIQTAMGWLDCHLHEFEIAGERYGIPDPDYDFEPLRNEQRVRLATALGGAKSFRYVYDFGDDWCQR